MAATYNGWNKLWCCTLSSVGNKHWMFDPRLAHVVNQFAHFPIQYTRDSIIIIIFINNNNNNMKKYIRMQHVQRFWLKQK